MKPITISVVIPTFRRGRALLRGLESLQEQVGPSFEVVVVDNAADPDVRRFVEEFSATAKAPVRYVPEPRLGLHYARHAGAHAARGPVLVFTDDDATFAPGWLQAYAGAFAAHPGVVAAGGPVRPVWEAPPPDWLRRHMGNGGTFGALSLMDCGDKLHASPDNLFFGVNMAVRRQALFDAGGFNPEAFGDVWLGDGETGLNLKLKERGLPIAYVPDALVYHHIPPQRLTVAYLCRREANQEASEAYTEFHRRMPRWPRLWAHLAGCAVRHAKYLAAGRFFRGRTDARSLYIQLRAARGQARLGYVLRMIFRKSFRDLIRKEGWLGPPNGMTEGAGLPAP